MDTTFINEYNPVNIHLRLFRFPLPALLYHIFPTLFDGIQRFFNPKFTWYNRLLFWLVPSVCRTAGAGFGLLLTPRAAEIAENPRNFVKRMGDKSDKCFPNLSSQVIYGRLLLIPTSFAGQGYGQAGCADGTHQSERNVACNEAVLHSCEKRDTRICRGY